MRPFIWLAALLSGGALVPARPAAAAAPPVLSGSGPGVACLLFSPDGRELLTPGANGAVRRWRLGVGRFAGPASDQMAGGSESAPGPLAAFSHAGDRLAVTSAGDAAGG